MSLTQHSSTNLKNEIHISTHYYVLLRISTHYAWSPSGTTLRLRTSLMIWDMSSLVLMRQRFLPEKRVGALFEQQLQPSASPPQRVWGIVRELQRGATHIFLDPPYFQRVGTYFCASIIKIRQQSVLCLAHATTHVSQLLETRLGLLASICQSTTRIQVMTRL